MKHIILTIICLTLIAAGAAAQKVNTDLKIDARSHDFGTINEADGVATCTFRLTNTGKQPITILSTRTGCSCVKAVHPSAPLQPGQSANLTVSYDPAGRSGKFHKEIAIISAGKKFNRVTIRGNVNPAPNTHKALYAHDLGHGLLTNYDQINFGAIAKGSEKTVDLRFTNDFPVTVKLTFEVQDPDPDISVEIPYSCILAPDREDRLPVTVSVKRIFKGTRTLHLLPIANSYKLSPITLTVRSK